MLNSFSDIELWGLVKRDNTLAFEILYNRYWEKVYTLSYWHLLDQNSAKDITQDLFIDLWNKRKTKDISESFEWYIRKAAQNRVINYIRNQNMRKGHYQVVGNAPQVEQANNYELKELKELYHQEIERLPEKMKNIYRLVKEHEMSVKDVAKHFGVSEQTIKNQLVTAAKKIRKALENYRPIIFIVLLFIF